VASETENAQLKNAQCWTNNGGPIECGACVGSAQASRAASGAPTRGSLGSVNESGAIATCSNAGWVAGDVAMLADESRWQQSATRHCALSGRLAVRFAARAAISAPQQQVATTCLVIWQ
jgi:hypothetical protein